MKKVFVTLLALFMIFAFTACDNRIQDPIDPHTGYTEITSENNNVEAIKALIEDDSVLGIWSENQIVIETKASEAFTVNRDFGFYNVAFEADLEGKDHPVSDKETTGKTHAINISGNDVTVTIEKVNFKNYTHALTVNDDSSVTLVLEDSKFDNCFKGLYAEGLDNLYVDNIIMTNMGIGSVASSSEKPTEAEKQARSGSGFDINQAEAGSKISILNSTFNGCGDPADKENSGITSGAIKIKVRGTDYKDANGSFKAVEIENNKFSGNRYDVVLGTGNTATTYPEELAKETTIQNCSLQDNSGNGWIIKDGTLAKDDTTGSEEN